MSETKPKIVIEWSAYGWDIFVGNRRYSWDHEDETMGTNAIVTMLYDLGYDVKLREVF